MNFIRHALCVTLLCGTGVIPTLANAATSIDTSPGSTNLTFGIQGTPMMYLGTTGLSVGLGSAPPSSSLQTAGEVQVGNSTVACTAANAGAIRYDASAAALEYCNGQTLSWVGLKNSMVSYRTVCDATGTGSNPNACTPPSCAGGAVQKGGGDVWVTVEYGGSSGYNAHNSYRSCVISSQSRSLAVYYNYCGFGDSGSCVSSSCQSGDTDLTGNMCEIWTQLTSGSSGTVAGDCQRACLTQQ